MILYKTDTSHKVLSIMVLGEVDTFIEASSPYHELYKTKDKVDFERHSSWWRLYIPFDNVFHDVSEYPIYEEHMQKFKNCYNVKTYEGSVIIYVDSDC